MSSDFVQIFDSLVAQVLSGDQNLIHQAESRIKSLQKDPNSIFELLNVIDKSTNHTSRQYSLIIIRKLIRLHSSMMNDEFQMNLFANLTQCLRKEDKLVNQYNICDILTDLSIGYENDLNLANDLFNSGLYATGFYLLTQFFGLRVPIEQQLEIAPKLYLISIDAMKNTDKEVRTQAYIFLQQLLAKVPDCDEINKNEELSGIILQRIQEVAEQKIERVEANELFNLIGELIHNATECFIEQHIILAKFISTLILQQDIDCYIRYSSTNVLIHLFEISIDSLMDIMPSIINNCLTFAIELSTVDPYCDDYKFPNELIEKIAEGIESESFVQEFFGIVCDLLKSNDEMTQRIGFSVLSSIILPDETLYTILDEAMELVINYISNGSLVVINEIGIVINKLCTIIESEMTSYIDDLFIPLLCNINLNECYNALINLLNVSDEPPVEIDKALNMLIESVKQSSQIEEQERFVLLLSEILQNYDKRNENIYNTFSPVISQLLLGNVTQKGLAISCFGDLARVCPLSVVSDLENFLPIILNTFSNNDYETNQKCCICILQICENQSQYLIPHLNTIFNAIDIILNLKQDNSALYQNDENEEEDDDEKENLIFSNFQNMQKTAFQCLISLCSNLPEQTSTHFDRVLNISNQIISNVFGSNEAIESLATLSYGFKDIGADPSRIFNILLEQITSFVEIDNCISAWRSLSVATKLFAKNLSIIYIEKIQNELLNVFTHQKNIYNQKGDSSEILMGIQEPVFSILETFVLTLKENFENYLQPFVECIVKLAQKRKNKSHPRAAHALIVISTTLSKYSNLFEFAFEATLEDLKSKSTETKSISLSAINIALHSLPKLIQGQSENLINLTWKIIEQTINGKKEISSLSEEAIALWFSLVQTYQINVNHDIVRSIWESAVFTANSTCLKYAADFALYCYETLSDLKDYYLILAITVFSSDEQIIEEISEKTLRFLIHLISSASDQEISETLSYNATMLTKFNRNLSKYKSMV